MYERPSLYAYTEGCTIKDTTNRDKPQDHEKAAGEEIIIRTLQKYGFLTRRLMQRNLNAYGHKSIDLTKTLKKMQQRKIVEKHTIYKETTDNISVFCLSEKERKNHPSKSSVKCDMTDIPYILEHLSTAQWEIGLLKNKEARECYYEQDVQTEKRIIHIPVIHRFKTTFDKDMYVAAIPVSRTNTPEGLRRFFLRINDVREFMESKRFRSPQMVIICESIRQIEDMAKLMSRVKETAGYYFLYCRDADTSERDPFSKLYGADILDDGRVVLNIISFKGEKPVEAAKRLVKKAKKTVEKVSERYGIARQN